MRKTLHRLGGIYTCETIASLPRLHTAMMKKHTKSGEGPPTELATPVTCAVW